MADFRKLQTVYWQSRPGAPVHCGTIVEVVPAGQNPKSPLKEKGMYRDEISYVVRVMRAKTERLYWPRTRWLVADEQDAKKVKRYKPWIAPSVRYKFR